MELSQCLAKHGIKITFVNTACAHKEVVNVLATMSKAIANWIRLVSIPDADQVKVIFLFMPGKVKEYIEEINASESDNYPSKKSNIKLDNRKVTVELSGYMKWIHRCYVVLKKERIHRCKCNRLSKIYMKRDPIFLEEDNY